MSNYAGGALPQNARDLVHRHLISLPQRFTMANMSSNDESSSADGSTSEAAKSGKRVMVLAQEGLDMMTQVSRVVNDTLVSAEGWCERLGRRPASQDQQQQLGQPAGGDEKMDHDHDHDRGRVRSETIAPSERGADRAQEKDDVHMQM